VALNLPAGQALHAVEPGALQYPAVQQTPAPALLPLPAAQAKQALAAVLPVFEL